MDELNFDDLLDGDSEIEKMTEPVIEEVEPEPITEYEEDTGLKIKPFAKEDTPDWQGSNLQNQFWSYSYEDSADAERIKQSRLSGKLVGSLIIVIILALTVGGVFYFKSGPKNTIDVTGLARADEEKISDTLGLTLHKSDVYSPRVRVINDNLVMTRADESFAVVYINNKQQGIFFDSKKYSLYGLKVGDTMDQKFTGIKFKYTDKYMDIVDYHAGKKEYYYLYNTTTTECMIVSIESKSKKIMELGYIYDYKQLLK